MITIDQDLWNLLFGWMQEGQCMIPEGCTVPLHGVIFYTAVILVLVAVVHWREKILEAKTNLLDFVVHLLDSM